MAQITVDLSGVRKKLSKEAHQRGQYAMANQALADMNQFVPKDDGILRMTTSIDTDGAAVNYNQPYAARMFYMMMYNYTTPGTGPRWDNKAKAMFMNDWIKAYMKGAGY